jgi:acetylornithine deacetylase
VDAISKMGPLLVALDRLGNELRARPGHPRLGTGSLHASLIHGGQELSSYPERCVLSVERRTIPGETAESVEAEFELLLQQLRAQDPTLQVTLRRGVDRTPMETPEESAIVQVILSQAEAVLARKPSLAGAPYWTDAATLTAAGIPSVLFGPVGAGAHAVEEWVDLKSAAACAAIYLACSQTFCG